MSYQREYEKRINIGMVGIGSHTYRNLLPALNYLPVRLKAICNRSNLEMAKATAEQYGCSWYQSTSEMYEKEELDAVFICVSPQMHPKLAIEAFDAGLHVWMEKPPAMRAFEVEEMIAKRGDKTALVGFKKAFMPAAEKAIEVINSDKYGNLISILAAYPMTMPENGEQILKERIFTNWLGNGCHPLSLMLTAGGKVDSVTTLRGKRGGGSCILQFENGAVGNFHMASGPQPIEEYHFYGDKWHLGIDDSSRVVLQRGIPFEYGKTVNYAPFGDDSGAVVWEPQNCLATLENKSLFVQGMVPGMKYFCDCILDNKKPQKGSLEFALELMRIYEAALLSNGKEIKLS